MKKSPMTSLYIHVRKAVASVIDEKDIYEYLPGGEASYPLCYMGEVMQDDIATKWWHGANVSFSLHFYTDKIKEKGSFYNLIGNCLMEIKRSKKSGFKLKNPHIMISGDNTTDKLLLHGILELEFEFL